MIIMNVTWGMLCNKLLKAFLEGQMSKDKPTSL